jgi:hypothetical protein
LHLTSARHSPCLQGAQSHRGGDGGDLNSSSQQTCRQDELPLVHLIQLALPGMGKRGQVNSCMSRKDAEG